MGMWLEMMLRRERTIFSAARKSCGVKVAMAGKANPGSVRVAAGPVGSSFRY